MDLLQMLSPSLCVLFKEQKCQIFRKSDLPILSLVDSAFGVVSKKALLSPRSSRLSPMLSSSFLVFIFHILVQDPFSANLCEGVRPVPWSTFCRGHWAAPVLFVKETILSLQHLSSSVITGWSYLSGTISTQCTFNSKWRFYSTVSCTNIHKYMHKYTLGRILELRCFSILTEGISRPWSRCWLGPVCLEFRSLIKSSSKMT